MQPQSNNVPSGVSRKTSDDINTVDVHISPMTLTRTALAALSLKAMLWAHNEIGWGWHFVQHKVLFLLGWTIFAWNLGLTLYSIYSNILPSNQALALSPNGSGFDSDLEENEERDERRRRRSRWVRALIDNALALFTLLLLFLSIFVFHPRSSDVSKYMRPDVWVTLRPGTIAWISSLIALELLVGFSQTFEIVERPVISLRLGAKLRGIRDSEQGRILI
ncbi:uncharacterized protein JN550_009756 [Neoarthrinium moseri]|uniref:uncharacterized protein n=1 Tax=Neoarthrinium moseri TaxID=1658444 RepID=UPI001FDB11F6|nr:uncharacterized protein JN550_009756 [Neoarthrinium moseri]KAI1863230.1 hypothetical protein JN550_009756 [Neoarthrinium moseri]